MTHIHGGTDRCPCGHEHRFNYRTADLATAALPPGTGQFCRCGHRRATTDVVYTRRVMNNLQQIALIDVGADRLQVSGEHGKAEAMRGLARELFETWLDGQMADGPALIMGDDGEWHCDPDAGDPDGPAEEWIGAEL